MGNIDNLTHSVIRMGRGKRFYHISNAEGKSWWIPARSIRMALNLYQPSTRNGRLLKALLPILHRMPFIHRIIHTETEQISLCRKLEDVLDWVFNSSDLEFAVFEGTPSINPKITIQLSSKSKILGYCKITDNPKVITQFFHEQMILEQLHAKGIAAVPRCLYCGSLTDTILIFIQSTEKTNHSVTYHQLGRFHWDFVKGLAISTRVKCSFEESDFALFLSRLSSYIGNFRVEDKVSVQTAIEIVQGHYQGKIVEFSACHGDFTPWNVFVEKNKLFAFDLEYAQLSCPLYMDICYFISQVAIHKLKYNPEEIYECFRKRVAKFPQEIEDPWFLCLCTLLYSLSIYFHLYEGRYDTKSLNYIGWVGLIKVIIQRHTL